MNIVFVDSNKAAVCEEILRSLPNWFGIESAIVDYISGVGDKSMWAAYYNECVVGFISVEVHDSSAAEIYVMGIREECHRMRLGQQLLDTAIQWLRSNQCKSLTVKTLGPSRPNEYYDRTRKFYEKMGFLPVEESKTIWGPKNPCLVMIKGIS